MNPILETTLKAGELTMAAHGEGQGPESVPPAQGGVEVLTLPDGRDISPKDRALFDALGTPDDGTKMILSPRELPPPIIDGMLLQKEFAAVTSDSKARKSFFLLLMAVCTAYGYPFFGFAATPTNVLYMNFELFPGAVDWRLAQIKKALLEKYLKDRFEPGKLHVWQLRGKKGLTLDNLANAILYRAWKDKTHYGLVIIDPAYKLWQGKDEISSADMGTAYGKLFDLPEELDAAVVACLHSPKGNNDKRRGLDLYSGSGVGGRSMDVSIALRIKHEEVDDPAPLTRVEITRRHLAAPAPFCIRWNPGKNVPEKTDEEWTTHRGQSGGTDAPSKPGFDMVDLFATPDTRLTAKELGYRFMLATGLSESTADNRKRELTKPGGPLAKSGMRSGTRYFLSPAGRQRWAKRHPDAAATAGDLPTAVEPATDTARDPAGMDGTPAAGGH